MGIMSVSRVWRPICIFGECECLLYEIKGNREHTQLCLQELDAKLHVILDWCEQVPTSSVFLHWSWLQGCVWTFQFNSNRLRMTLLLDRIQRSFISTSCI